MPAAARRRFTVTITEKEPKTRQGFWFAQGIAAEIPEAPALYPHAKACGRTYAARRSAGKCYCP
jgi:hypothetical protein